MSDAIDKTRLLRLFSSQNIQLSDAQAEQFNNYAELLVEWNQKINLTAITEPQEIEEKHFLDSCLPFADIDIPKFASVVDVGTGAGFPGIPLKIIRPDIGLTLVDSLQKRITFLETCCAQLGVVAKTIHGRAEELGRSDMRESFDIATARAVARLSVLCEYCLPFVKVGGVFVALKGRDCAEEIRLAYTAIKTMGGEILKTVEYSLPSGDGRTAVIIKKVKPTPPAYPRTKAKMEKKPL